MEEEQKACLHSQQNTKCPANGNCGLQQKATNQDSTYLKTCGHLLSGEICYFGENCRF